MWTPPPNVRELSLVRSDLSVLFYYFFSFSVTTSCTSFAFFEALW